MNIKAASIDRAAKDLSALAKEYWVLGTNGGSAEVGDILVHWDDEAGDTGLKAEWSGKIKGFGLALYAIGGDHLMDDVFDAAEDLTDSDLEFQLLATAVSRAWDGIGEWLA